MSRPSRPQIQGFDAYSPRKKPTNIGRSINILFIENGETAFDNRG
jgi:hypothetical protein